MSEPRGDAVRARSSRRGLILRTAVAVLLCVAAIYLVREVVAQADAIAAWRPTAADGWLLAALALGHGAALLLLTECWHGIVRLFAPEERARTWPSHTMTQVARYVPGNVAHLLGRAAWLRGGALSDAALGRATLVELVLIPLAAALALALAAPLLPWAALLGPLGLGGLAGAAPIVAPLLLMAGAGAGLPIAALAAGGEAALGRRVAALVRPLILATGFMLWLGASFALVASIVGPVAWPVAFAAGLAAWLAGYATPGAPGGLGVREAVLVAVLTAADAGALAILAAALHRLVTTVGDLVCFLIGLGLRRAFARRTATVIA